MIKLNQEDFDVPKIFGFSRSWENSPYFVKSDNILHASSFISLGSFVRIQLSVGQFLYSCMCETETCKNIYFWGTFFVLDLFDSHYGCKLWYVKA